MYKFLDDQLFRAEGGGDALALLLRMSYEQFPYQESMRSLIPRTLALFDRLPGELATAHPFDIDAAARRAFGMPLRDFMRTGLAVGATARQNRGRLKLNQMENLIVPGLSEAVESDRLRLVLRVIGGSYGEFKKLHGERSTQFPVPVGYEKYAHNVLLEKPVVWSDGDSSRMLVPSPILIFKRVTLSVYYDLLAVGGDAFAIWFGYVVQEYVDRLLGHFKNLIREWDFGVEGAPDFAVVDGSRGALIEVKSGRLSIFSRAIGDKQHVRDDVKKHLFPAVEQLHKKREKIRTRASGFERLFGVQEPHLVVVTLEPIYLANAPPIRDVIDELAREKGWDPIPYHAISLNEFEIIAQYLTGKEFLDALDRKRAQPYWPFEAMFEDRLGELRKEMHPWLKALWEDFSRRNSGLSE